MANNEQFVGKKVVLTHNLSEPNEKGETAEEVEGTVEAAAQGMLMFKPKGKTTATLIQEANIESIDYAPEKAKKLGRKTLKEVQFGQARNHLLERHGVTLAEINGMSEKQAFEKHNAIDHEAFDLGHVHGDKDKDKAEVTESD